MGVIVRTNLTNTAGFAFQQGLVTTTITTTKGSTSATVGSGTNLGANMVIGAQKVADPTTGVMTSALVPGTYISSIVGTAVTLSQSAAESGTNLYCASCYWRDLSTIQASGWAFA